MIPYDLSEEPPLIAMKCKISNPVFQTKSREANGKVDTGAAATNIPENWVNPLGLVPVRPVIGIDYKGVEEQHWTYLANVSIDGFNFKKVEVTAVPRDNVLIGRDILNQLNVFLYGRDLQFDVSWP